MKGEGRNPEKKIPLNSSWKPQESKRIPKNPERSLKNAVSAENIPENPEKSMKIGKNEANDPEIPQKVPQ